MPEPPTTSASRPWGWAIPEWIAAALRQEFGAPFVGRDEAELDLTVPVDRTQQLRTIGCHGSQLLDNTVPHRRIEVSGDTESLRLPPRRHRSRWTGSR